MEKDSSDKQPETQPVRKWRARLRDLLLWAKPRQHDHADRDAQGRRW